MLKFGQGYVDKGMEHYEAKYRQDQIRWLAKSAAALAGCGKRQKTFGLAM
jgi:hypothetical protein